MALKGGLLAITGIVFDLNTAFCFPAVALYTYNANTQSWSNPTLVQLVRPSPPKTAGNYLPPVSTNGHASNIWSNMACPGVSGGPANAISVDISTEIPNGQTTRNLVFGVPSQTCTYLTSYANLTHAKGPLLHVQCLPSNQVAPMGMSVGWQFPDGTRFSVTSNNVVNLYDINDFISGGLSNFIFQVPNRLMLTTGGTRPIRQSATSNAGMIALLVTDLQQPDTELFPATNLPPGQLFSYNKYVKKPCPSGRYKSATDFTPCLYCPAGTYYNGTGATACLSCTEENGGGGDGVSNVGEGEESGPYCPTGSIFPYPPALVEPSEPAEPAIPEFEADEFKEVFEDLLIATIFAPLRNRRYPIVIMWLIFTFICMVLAILSTCSRVRACRTTAKKARAALTILARLRHIVEGKFHSKKEKARRLALKHAEEAEEDRMRAGGHTPLDAKKKKKKNEAEEEEEGGITKSAEFEGYVTVVFALFSLSAIAFTVDYVTTYEPTDMTKGPEEQNIFRSQTIIYRGQEVPEYQTSLESILTHGFTVSIELIGMAGTSTCDAGHMALNFTFDGCNLPGQNGGCEQLVQYAPAPEWLPHTCVATLELPEGTSLLDTSDISLKIPSYVSFQALRLNYTQHGGEINLEKLHTENHATIQPVVFSELLKFPNSSTLDPPNIFAESYLQSSIGREWVITPVQARSQREGQWDDIFDSLWYTQVVSTLPPVLPTQNLTQFLFVDQADGISINVNLQINLYFTQLLSQRLVGENEVILTILLAIIAIFHVTEMAEKITVMSISFFGPLCSKCYDDYWRKDGPGGGEDSEGEEEPQHARHMLHHSGGNTTTTGGHAGTSSSDSPPAHHIAVSGQQHGSLTSSSSPYTPLPAHAGGGKSPRELRPMAPEHHSDPVAVLAMHSALNTSAHAKQPLLNAQH